MGTTARRFAIAAGAAVAWAVWRLDVGPEAVNERGWPSLRRFVTAVADPELAAEFLRLTLDAALTTLAYAVLGTALSLIVGAIGALLLAERLWGRRPGWHVARAVFVVPRAIHEIVWALLLVRVLGFDPLVAVVAIGVPFGAVTAKVYAEAIDQADQAPYDRLRVIGAGRLTSLAYGVLPQVRGQLASYAFYRFECAIRSAAVLGVIGAGGLGFQLDLSFRSLRYGEMWTLLAALMVLSGAVDAWSSRVRRSRSPLPVRRSLAGIACLVPLTWWWIGLELSPLWSARTWGLAVELVAALLPGRLGPAGWSELLRATLDTAAMSIVAVVIAGLGAVVLGALAARPVGHSAQPPPGASTGRWSLRLLLLLCRAVPAPVWAFLVVLVLFPGPLPGAVALGLYNVGVLGRLFAEVFEERDVAAGNDLATLGAGPVVSFAYATLPTCAPRLIALALYRWEVIVRETVVVGVVGAGGLGRLLQEHRAARDLAAMTSVLVALVVLSLTVDALSAATRRVLPPPSPSQEAKGRRWKPLDVLTASRRADKRGPGEVHVDARAGQW